MPLPIRLVVGHQSLELGAQVRILYRQPTPSQTYTVAAWPVRLVAQDTALSRLKQGFDSPTGYHAMRQVRDIGSPLRALGCGKL